jgi:hypothetical protein
MQVQVYGTRLVNQSFESSQCSCRGCEDASTCSCYAKSDTPAQENIPLVPTSTQKLHPLLLYSWVDNCSEYLLINSMAQWHSERIGPSLKPASLANRDSQTKYCTFLI